MELLLVLFWSASVIMDIAVCSPKIDWTRSLSRYSRVGKGPATSRSNPDEFPGLESNPEYRRLQTIVEAAAEAKWNYYIQMEEEQVQANAMVPWLVDVGEMVENTFIRYCAASMVDPEVKNTDRVLITSAPCGRLLQKAEARATMKLQGMYLSLSEEILNMKYLRDYRDGKEANVAIIGLNMDTSSPDYGRDHQVLYLPSPKDKFVEGTTGTVGWRVYDYDSRDHMGIPTRLYTEHAVIQGCPSQLRGAFCARILTNQDIPEVDLGGSPFYVQESDSRMVLKGVRYDLEGDYFTDMAKYSDKIRQIVKKTARKL